MLKKLIQQYYIWRHKGGLDLKQEEKDGKDNYVLGWSLFKGTYQPKQVRTNNAARLLETMNQGQINICACINSTNGKQVDEGCLLDYQWLVAYLVSIGKMSNEGTSMSAPQDVFKNLGIPARGNRIINTGLTFDAFAKASILTSQSLLDAEPHKIESYYKVYDLNAVLEAIDEKKMCPVGSDWYSGYNPSQLPDTCIVTPYAGYKVGGHLTLAVDYDTDYFGYKVIKIAQSYGPNRPFYYVKFEDFNKVCNYGAIINSDIPKDTLSWLDLNQGSIVKELNGPNIYIIEGKFKRSLVDEALWQMMSIALNKPTAIDDNENMLPQIAEGKPVTFEEIPQWAKDTALRMAEWSTNKQWVVKTFGPYFPTLNT